MGGIHNYLNGQIQFIGSKVSLEILEKLRNSCEQFRNEIGAQLNSLKEAKGEIVSGVETTAQAVEYKLTENEESNNKPEKVSTSMYTDLQKITQVLGKNRE